MNIPLDSGLAWNIILAIVALASAWVTKTVRSEIMDVKHENERANAALEKRITDNFDLREKAMNRAMEDRDSRILARLESIQKDISTGYIPARLAEEQRGSILHRLEKVEEEIENNRRRIHDISNDILKSVTQEIFRLNQELLDKGRRGAANATNIEALQRQTQDLGNRLHDLERTK